MIENLKTKANMDAYLAELRKMSGAVWSAFTHAAMNGKDAEFQFQNLERLCEGMVSEAYTKKYIEICRHELIFMRNPMQYIQDAQKDTGNIWNIFKRNVEKLYKGELAETDWTKIAREAANVAYDREDMISHQYAMAYSCLCVDELDRCYRRINHIKENWYELLAPQPK